jgi:hypothetical protein
MRQIVPDLAWYSGISRDRGLASRCPFATVEACPRYWASRSLLGEAGSTPIAAAEDARLKVKWEASDLLGKTAEDQPALGKFNGDAKQFVNFCPEVLYDRFGHFTSYLSRYGDELDAGSAYERLTREGGGAGDPRWNWAYSTALHYSDCPTYSPLLHRSQKQKPPAVEKPKAMVKKVAEGVAVRLIVLGVLGVLALIAGWLGFLT